MVLNTVLQQTQSYQINYQKDLFHISSFSMFELFIIPWNYLLRVMNTFEGGIK